MAFIDDIKLMGLSEEAEQKLIDAHNAEISPLADANKDLAKDARTKKVDAEIAAFSDGIFKGQPGVLKFVRRVLLSDDEQAGTVLLSDEQMGLSGDDATGAKHEEDKSTADVLRDFIAIATEHKIQFSDQALVEDAGDPPGSGEEPTAEEKSKGARERLGAITGNTGERSRARYNKHTGGVV